MDIQVIDAIFYRVYLKYKECYVQTFQRFGNSHEFVNVVHGSLEEIDFGRYTDYFKGNITDEYENKGLIHLLADESDEVWWGKSVLKLNNNLTDKSTPLSIQLLFNNSKLDLIKTLILLFSFSLTGAKKYRKLQEIVFYYSLVNFNLIAVFNENRVDDHLLSINQYYRFQSSINQILLHLWQLEFIEVKGDLSIKTLDIGVRLTVKGKLFVEELKSDYFHALINDYSNSLDSIKYSSENLKKLKGEISLTIRLNKLILQGAAYRRTLTFNDGLTVISGDKTSGKSLVLSLIDYCLGKTKKIDLKVQRELSQYCDQIFLEIRISDEIITINRALKEKWDKLGVYFCSFSDMNNYSPKIVDRDELLSLLMRKLNINEYKLIKHQKHSNKQELEQVSFRDVFRYIYIHQHELGTHDFLANKSTFKRYKNPHAFKMMFELIDKDKDDLKEQLVNAKNQIDDANKVINGLRSYLKERDAEIYLELWNRSNEFDAEIKAKKDEKASIILNGRNNKNNENVMYISLKNELTEIANQIFNHQKQKNNLTLSIQSKALLKKNTKLNLQKLKQQLK